MAKRKHILKVWGLPDLSQEKHEALHEDLVAAAVKTRHLCVVYKNEIIILFLACGPGSDILVEFHEATDGHYHERQLFTSELGNIVKRHAPSAFVQCEVRSDSGEVCYWTSRLATTREEVARVHAAAQSIVPKFMKAQAAKCYCDTNAADNRGPCGHCNMVSVYKNVIKEGARVLGLPNSAEFQAAADVYVDNCRGHPIFRDLHIKVRWLTSPLTAV